VVAIVKGNANPHSIIRLRKLLCLFVESGLNNTIRYRHSPKDTYDVSKQAQSASSYGNPPPNNAFRLSCSAWPTISAWRLLAEIQSRSFRPKSRPWSLRSSRSLLSGTQSHLVFPSPLVF